MSRLGRIPAGRLVAEFLVIVIGVLVALGVDRWVAGIDERDQELAYLTGLRADFIRNRAIAENGTRVSGDMAELALVLLESLEGRAPSAEPPLVLVAAEVTGWWYYASYAEGVWNDLQSTGRTQLLRDATLRREVSEFYRTLQWQSELDVELNEELYAYQVAAQRFIDPRVLLALSENFSGWEGFRPPSLLERLEGFDVASILARVTSAEELAAPLARAIIVHRSRADIFGEDLREIGLILEIIDRAVGAL